MGATTERRLPFLTSRRYVGLFVGGIAVAFLVTTIWLWRETSLNQFGAFILAIPAVSMVVLLILISRSSLPSEHFIEVLNGLVVGAGSTGTFILAILLYQGTPLIEEAPFLIFLMGLGGLAGELIGMTRGLHKHAKQQANELETQQDRLVFLNQLLRHNVLNKIAIIDGHAELLGAEDGSENSAVETIRTHSNDVEELITNVRVLFNNSITDQGTESVNLSAALRSEIESLEQSFEEIEIEAEVPEGVRVVANDLLRYVFENVLHNAVEHNDAETPCVEIAVEREGKNVVVTIRDNGPGVPPHISEGLDEGTLEANHGIGLYLVNTLMTEYDGSLEFVDTRTDGTTLRLTFQAAESSPVSSLTS